LEYQDGFHVALYLKKWIVKTAVINEDGDTQGEDIGAGSAKKRELPWQNKLDASLNHTPLPSASQKPGITLKRQGVTLLVVGFLCQ
jgi:hypothetical protein